MKTTRIERANFQHLALTRRHEKEIDAHFPFVETIWDLSEAIIQLQRDQTVFWADRAGIDKKVCIWGVEGDCPFIQDLGSGNRHFLKVRISPLNTHKSIDCVDFDSYLERRFRFLDNFDRKQEVSRKRKTLSKRRSRRKRQLENAKFAFRF